MEDNDLVQQIEAMVDDEEARGEPEGVARKSKRTRSIIVSVRFSPSEPYKLQARADERGMTVSACVREIVLKDLEHNDYVRSTPIEVINQAPANFIDAPGTCVFEPV